MALDYLADVTAGTSTITADRNNKMRDQLRPAFLTTAARGTAIPSPEDGQQSYLATGDSTEGPEEYHSNGSWRKPWNMPWGFIDSASYGTLQSGIGTSFTDLTDLSVTFTAVANRRYEVRARCVLEKASTQDLVELILANAANTEIEHLAFLKMNTLDITTFNVSAFLDSIGAGSQTFKLRGKTDSGTFDVRNDSSTGKIWVMDVGPDGAPA